VAKRSAVQPPGLPNPFNKQRRGRDKFAKFKLSDISNAKNRENKALYSICKLTFNIKLRFIQVPSQSKLSHFIALIITAWHMPFVFPSSDSPNYTNN
jgi:hypothetical protein